MADVYFQMEKEPHSLQVKAKGLDLVWRAVKAFLRKSGPKDMQESAWGRGGEMGEHYWPRESLMQRPCSGMDHGTFWEWKGRP